MEQKQKRDVGRPTTYTPELGLLICQRVATHDVGIKRLCDMYDDMPDKTTIRLWKIKHSDFSDQYAQAKRVQCENLAEDIIDISDDSSQDTIYDDKGNQKLNGEWVARSRLKVDSRKWIASKLAPKIYGDKQQTEVTVKHEESIKDLA